MKKRDYERTLRSLDEEAQVIEKARSSLIAAFRQDCKHPEKSLQRETNYMDDEYGKWMESWTTYTFSCNRCGTVLPDTKNHEMTVKDLRASLNNVNCN